MSKIKISGLTVALILQGYLSLFVFGFIDNARGPYFPDIITDLVLSDSKAAWFFGATSCFALVGSQITPYVLRFLSLQNTLRLGLIFLGVTLYALSYVSNFLEMVIATSVMGLFFGLINVTQNLAIQFGSTEELRPRIFSGLHSMYALSSLLAPLLIAYMTHSGYDWRQGFRVFAIVISLAGIVSYLFVSKSIFEVKSKEEVKTKKYDWKVIVLAFCMAFYVAGELAISSRLVLLLRRSYNYTAEDASFVLSVFFGLLFIGRLLAALIKIKTKNLKPMVFYSLITSIFFFAMGLLIDERFLAVTGLTMAPFFGIYLTFLGIALKEKVVLAMSFALAAGTVTVVPMHIAVGALTDVFGLHHALWVGAGCLLMSLILFVEFNRRVKV